MTIKKITNIAFLYGIVLLFFGVGFFARCANPAAPEGGPKDTIPPKIVNIDPPMFTKNFAAEKITILFDEYVQVQNSQTEILVSPEPEIKPTYTVKGKSVVVDLRNTELDSATTYKIDFGLAIKDNNESNPLINFAYVFSTGNEIDSLAMSGQVIDAFTGDSIFNALVMLFDASKDSTILDSVLYRSKPNSITRTDSMGVFLAINLQAIDYRVYAIKEETTDGKYSRASDMVAFVDSLYNPTQMNNFQVWYNPLRQRIEATPQVVYRLFTEPALAARHNLKKSSRPQKNVILLEFTEKFPEIISIALDSVSIDDVVVDYSRSRDSITLYYPYMESFPDTLKGAITYNTTTTDTIPKDTTVERTFSLGFREVKDKKKKKEDEEEKIVNPFKMSFETGRTFNPYSDYVLKSGLPLKVVDSTRIVISKESSPQTQAEQRAARGARTAAPSQPAAPTAQAAPGAANSGETDQPKETIEFTIEQDSLDILKWRIKAAWEDGVKYSIFIPDSVFVDVYNQKNDTTRSDFTIFSQEKFGLVKLKVEGFDAASLGRDSLRYIVQFIERKDVVYQKYVEGDGEIVFEYVKPSKYSIKIVEDSNYDGVWSEGVLIDKIQPERIAFYSDEKGNRYFEVKENWEMEGTTINLEELFAN
ncbi:MAG: Ig-like domain-containing protein [Rikenellaceae bacterium]